MSDIKTLFIGVDDGYAETKVVTSRGTMLRIPSRARSGENTLIDISKKKSKTIYEYTVDGQNYVAGEIEDPDPIAHDDYPTSDLNRVIVNHAIRKVLEVEGIAPSSDISVLLCTGLPVKRYYVSGKMDEELFLAKQNSLLRNNVLDKTGAIELPRIVRHEILAEAIAAWMDFVLVRDPNTLMIRKDAEAMKQKIGIIDIGGRTTDIAVIQGGSLNFAASSTIEAGMLNIHQLVEDKIKVPLTPPQIAQAVETKKVKIYGKEEDVSQIITEAEATVVHSIKSEVSRKIGRAADFDKILFVGGTSQHLKEHLTDWFPHQIFDTDPSFSNARGMQKYAEMVMGSKAKKGN